MEKFLKLRENYPSFYYRSYEIKEEEDMLSIVYDFEIPGLTHFYPQLRIPKKNIQIEVNQKILEYLVFHILLIEMISYVKCTCSKHIYVEAGYIDSYQIQWLKKLFYLHAIISVPRLFGIVIQVIVLHF